MMSRQYGRKLWGALWRSNDSEGVHRHLLTEACIPKLFLTRRETREWIKEHYGYIANRPDLRRQPHGWRMPIPVRVVVTHD